MHLQYGNAVYKNTYTAEQFTAKFNTQRVSSQNIHMQFNFQKVSTNYYKCPLNEAKMF